MLTSRYRENQGSAKRLLLQPENNYSEVDRCVPLCECFMHLFTQSAAPALPTADAAWSNNDIWRLE